MNKRIRFIERFFRFTFFGKVPSSRRSSSEDVYPIEEIQMTSENQPEKKPPSREQVRNQLITKINWLLMIVCLFSFAFIIIYPFVHPDKSVSDIIQNAFFTTLGWFGGVLGAFFQVEQNKNNL